MNREEIEIGQEADPVDQGSKLAEAERVQALEKHKLKVRRDYRPHREGEVARLCAGVDEPDDCGEMVEAERFAHGYIRCVSCQTRVDSLRKRGLRR